MLTIYGVVTQPLELTKSWSMFFHLRFSIVLWRHGVVEYLGFGNIDNGVHQCTILHTVSDEEVGFQQPMSREDTTSSGDTAMIYRTI